jgi:excisionase family DNA binding protein
MTVNGSEDRMLSTEEVAKWLGIATRTVCTWAECNELPAVKVGRQWRFRRSSVAKWLEKPNRLQNPEPAATAASAAYSQHKPRL